MWKDLLCHSSLMECHWLFYLCNSQSYFCFSALDLLSWTNIKHSVVFSQHAWVKLSFLTSFSLWHYRRHWGETVISENSLGLYFLKAFLVTNPITQTHTLHTKLSRLYHMGFTWKDAWSCLGFAKPTAVSMEMQTIAYMLKHNTELSAVIQRLCFLFTISFLHSAMISQCSVLLPLWDGDLLHYQQAMLTSICKFRKKKPW